MTTDFVALSRIRGLTPIPVCEELYQLAAAVPPAQAIVEIGVYLGRTACYLGAGAQSGRGAHVWAIDPWDLPGDRGRSVTPTPGKRHRHRERFTQRRTRLAARRNIHKHGLRKQVTRVREFSAEVGAAWDGPEVGLLFVDGDHDEAAVLADWAAWRQHLARGAVVAWDDYAPAHPGVMAAVDQLAAAGEITTPEVLHKRLAVTSVRRRS